MTDQGGDGDARISRLEDLVERRLAALQVNDGNWTAEQIKEYIEAMLSEKDRALEMADDEREKAASALREAQQRALEQAERERSKAAENLRVELARSIREGDERLSEHITNQIHQIREALMSAERLELARLDELKVKIDEVARETTLIHNASQTAILETKENNQKAFSDANEWRQQSADRERTQQENIARLTATFAPREVVDQTSLRYSERLDALERWQFKIIGAMAFATILVPGLTGLAVYLLTRSAITVK